MITRLILAISFTLIIQEAKAQFINQAPQTEEKGSVVFKQNSPQAVAPTPKKEPQKLEEIPIQLYETGDMRIIAIVNGEMISSTDIEQRAKAFVMNTKIPFNTETKRMIIAKVIQSAIDEKLKIQEALKQGIDITEKDIDLSVKSFESSNKIPEGKLKELLAQNGVSMKVFREQIKSDLAWIRVVRRQMTIDGELTDKEIEEGINESARDMSTPKYMVSEIVIKKPNAKNLEDLVANLRRDPRFELYAAQFSESPSASNGGNLGWLNEGQLIEPLNSKVLAMKDGEVSDPIQIGNDFYILKLVQTYHPEIDKPNLPTKEEMRRFMENKRLEEVSDKLLHNIRQKAVIELRN